MKNPIVIAPTIHMAEHVCSLFSLNPRQHIASGNNPEKLRGLGRDTVFMLYYDAPWKPEVYREVLRTIEASGGLIIMVPELQLVKRPTSAGMSW